MGVGGDGLERVGDRFDSLMDMAFTHSEEIGGSVSEDHEVDLHVWGSASTDASVGHGNVSEVFSASILLFTQGAEGFNDCTWVHRDTDELVIIEGLDEVPPNGRLWRSVVVVGAQVYRDPLVAHEALPLPVEQGRDHLAVLVAAIDAAEKVEEGDGV